jgi:uncharacterized protein YecA (UPF0149 family)
VEIFQQIDAKIKEGYTLIRGNDYSGGCDKWLEAWEEIKGLFADGIASDIFDLNDKYGWTQYISNYAQDLEMELHNAGVDDRAYHQKRVDFCRELLQWCSDDMTKGNSWCSMAEAHFELGDTDAGDQIFFDLLKGDPDCGSNYISWAGCYLHNTDVSQYEKAEEILLAGCSRSGLRDKADVLGLLIDIYDAMGKPDKAKEYRKILKEHIDWPDIVFDDKPAPVRVVKIGRNEPCPCGSGKKYKKCCGA